MENKQNPVPAGEIDLAQLFSNMRDFLLRTGMALLHLVARIRSVPINNRLLFVAIIVLSMAMTIGYGLFVKKKFYESTMILSSNYLNKRIVDNTIGKLNLLAAEENKGGLSRILKVDSTLASNIVSLEAKPFIAENDITELEVLKEQLKTTQETSKNPKVIDQVLERIEIENRHAFEITVRTYNPSVINDLQTALVNYVRENAYIKKRIESNKLSLESKKSKLIRESYKLDSLKDVIYENYKSMAGQARAGSNNVILSDHPVTNPIDVYFEDIKIYDEIQYIERQLYIQPDFEVVDGFTEFSEPASASLTKMLAQTVLIAIGIGYLIVALRNFNKYLAGLG